MDKRIVEGMVYLEKNLMDGESVTSPRLRTKLLTAGYDEVVSSIYKAASFYSNGGANIYARGILEVLNYKMRNRVKMKGLVDED